MKKLGIWLYRYMTININHGLLHVLAVLDSLAPSPGYRPALQRVRTPVSPSVSNVRVRNDFLTPWI